MATTVAYSYTGANTLINALIEDGFKWSSGTPVTTIKYFFAGPDANHSASSYFNWSTLEKTAAIKALNTWAAVANLSFVQGTFLTADLVEYVTTAQQAGATYGSHDLPDAPPNWYSEGFFNRAGPGWDETNASGGLNPGGDGFYTLIHEFGHALGLKHPHDAPAFPGVTNGNSSQLGQFLLNQGIFTVMSYNYGHFSARDMEAKGIFNYGFNTGPSALDIAAIQQLYGVRASHTGNDVYTLPDHNGLGTAYSCLWDTGGTDMMRYTGTHASTIDLRAATLLVAAGGGGFLSDAAGIFGGLTIANGVVIENASGGSGADRILGNSAANVVFGNAGADTLIAGAGNDTLVGGLGKDTQTGGAGLDRFVFKAVNETTTVLTSADVITDFLVGTDKVHLAGIDAIAGGVDNVFAWRGTAALTGAGQLRYVKHDAAGAVNDYTIVAGSTDADATAEFWIKLTGAFNLAATDFVL